MPSTNDSAVSKGTQIFVSGSHLGNMTGTQKAVAALGKLLPPKQFVVHVITPDPLVKGLADAGAQIMYHWQDGPGKEGVPSGASQVGHGPQALHQVQDEYGLQVGSIPDDFLVELTWTLAQFSVLMSCDHFLFFPTDRDRFALLTAVIRAFMWGQSPDQAKKRFVLLGWPSGLVDALRAQIIGPNDFGKCSFPFGKEAEAIRYLLESR